MKNLSKVVWSEGMYLSPHHFQTQARFFEDSIHFVGASLWYSPFGFSGSKLDSEALRNGTVSVVHARGVLPDGLPFQAPECDPAPEPRGVADIFPPTREFLTVLLAIPPARQSGANCTLAEPNGQPATRFSSESKSLHDDNTGRDEKPVHVGRKNIRLLFDTEDAGDMVTLPLARVMRDSSGQYVYDPRFIAPCLQINASERLMQIARRLIEILEEKSAQLARGRRGEGKFRAGFSAQEVASFWFQHSINAALSPLRHLYFSKRGHPEELFAEMARLGGALCTFGLDSNPAGLPLYDHLHLDDCFEQLDQHIRKHLEIIVPSNCIEITLKMTKKYFYEGEVTDTRCLGRSRWVFALQSNIGEAEMISRTPKLVKISSAVSLGDVVKRALPGLRLTHLPMPPGAISPKVESQYYGVSKAGTLWEQIMETRKVGVYVPGELPDPEIELLVVLDS